MIDDLTLGQKLFLVKKKINEMKRHLDHQDHVEGEAGEMFLNARGARAIVRAALHEVEELL